MAIESVALPKLPLDAIPEARFYISATGPTRPRRVLKHGDTFIVVDSHGDIGASPGGTDGLFHCDTRFLSHLELLLNGMQPLLLGSNVRDDNTQLTVDLTNPDIYFDQRLILPKDTVHVVRTIFLWGDTAYQRIAVRNYGDHAIDLRLSLLFDGDFADLFEVRGLQRTKHGHTSHSFRTDRAVLTYGGLDDKQRQTALNFDPQPTELTATSAAYAIHLPPKAAKSMFLTVSCGSPTPPRPLPFLHGLRKAHRERIRSSQNASTVVSSNDIFNEVMCRSMADLYMLMTDTPEGRYPYAGIPWYSTTFGRDGLLTALQMLWLDPRVAQGVLRRLAAFQAKTADDASDAQPGKILHEMREGEMAALGEVPFGLYYGSVDATPLFVMLAGLYAERTGDDAIIVELWPAIKRRSSGSMAPAISMATALSNTTAQPSGGSPIKVGRTPKTLFSTPMAAWQKVQSRWPRYRVTSIALSRFSHAAPSGSDGPSGRGRSKPKRISWPNDSTRASGVRSWAPTRSPSTARKNPVAYAARMPARFCSPASPSLIGRSR